MKFVKPIPFQEAVDKIGTKSPIGSRLNSAEWSHLPVALRERGFFSATVENVRFLGRAQQFIGDYLSGAVETLPNGKKALKAGSRAQFVRDMSAFAKAEGMGPLDPEDKGTIKDITSQARLSLIFNVQTQSAHDYGNWKQGQDPDVLDAYPAQRFIRDHSVNVKRVPHQLNEGRVELKSSLDFWVQMNVDFHVPWGPWGFNSGMGVEDVDREEAEKLGLLKPGEAVQPVEKDFNDRLEASLRGLSPDLKAKLKGVFGPQIEIEGDSAKWVPGPQPKTQPQIAPKPEPKALPKPKPSTALVPQTKPGPVGRIIPPFPGQLPAQPKPVAEPSTLPEILKALDLAGDRKATALDMMRLREELKEKEPAKAEDFIEVIDSNYKGTLSEEAIRSAVDEFVSFVPKKWLNNLPKLSITAYRAKDNHKGGYTFGSGQLTLNREYLDEEFAFRKTSFHELTHWLHVDGKNKEWQAKLKAHFEERTKGENIQPLPGYLTPGKKDNWYEAYAGKIYSLPMEKELMGLEVPTRYMEWLQFSPEQMAKLWNDKSFRETMLIVLEGLF